MDGIKTAVAVTAVQVLQLRHHSDCITHSRRHLCVCVFISFVGEGEGGRKITSRFIFISLVVVVVVLVCHME
jgi:hypothetical protein